MKNSLEERSSDGEKLLLKKTQNKLQLRPSTTSKQKLVRPFISEDYNGSVDSECELDRSAWIEFFCTKLYQ